MTNRDAEQAQLVWFRSGGGHYLDRTTSQGWTMTYATGDGAGVISYFERPVAG